MKFGSTMITLKPVPDKVLTFGQLSLLNGILATCDAKMLIQVAPVSELLQRQQDVVNNSGSWENFPAGDRKCSEKNISELKPAAWEGEILLLWLHRQLCQMSLLTASQYQVFRLLLQYYSKLTKLFNQISSLIDIRIFDLNSSILKQLLDLLWTHLDSPVEGVGECVLDIFRSSLTLAQIEHRHHFSSEMSRDMDEFEQLINELLVTLLKMSWQVRGRHNLLSVVLTFTDIKSVSVFYQDKYTDQRCSNV